jgi:uncharacterized membrane protein
VTRLARGALAASLAALAACGDEAVPADDACADEPVLTWDTFGDAFLRTNCQGCHASTAPDRHGAPEDVTFDTRDESLAQRDRILARSAGAAPTMPPGGGVDEVDRGKLTVWLTCFDR